MPACVGEEEIPWRPVDPMYKVLFCSIRRRGPRKERAAIGDRAGKKNS